MNLIDKLRKQPKSTRKILLFLAVIIIGAVLAFFWIRDVSQKIKIIDFSSFETRSEEKINQ